MTEKPNLISVITRIVIWTAIMSSTVVAVLLVMAFILQRQTGFEGKTLWDWMVLLLVPLFLAAAAFLLNTLEKSREVEADRRRAEHDHMLEERRAETERNQALDRMREDRLQAYVAAMKELLLLHHLRASEPEAEVRHVARTLTLTVLRELGGERTRALLLFLYEAKLLHKDNPIVLLKEADLSGAFLRNAKLIEADLSGAVLNGAFLIEANLSGANMGEADLSHAALTVANLSKANLCGADLRWADLRWADLSEAILSGADLSEVQYNIATKWPEGFNPVAAGANKADEPLPDETSAAKTGQT